MNRLIIKFVFVLILIISFVQSEYKKIGKYDEYNKDWVFVKIILGIYGFIN